MFWCRLSALYHSLSADADSLSGPPSIALPFVSSLAFGLHPMRAETVRWLSAGGYGIAGLLMLLSLACFTEFVVARKARHMQVRYLVPRYGATYTEHHRRASCS